MLVCSSATGSLGLKQSSEPDRSAVIDLTADMIRLCLAGFAISKKKKGPAVVALLPSSDTVGKHH